MSDTTAVRPGDPAAERDRLSDALERCAAELELLAVQTTARAGESVGAIFEAQALFARDRGIIDPAFALIEAGTRADEAILRATADQADRLAAVDDEYFRERAADAVWAEASGWKANGVSVVANVASALEAEAAVRAGAEAIGLVRTELLFLGRSTPPSIGEQRATYARIHDVMGDRPVVFRTLDVGGDKPAEWQSAAVEANPALGVRGLRLGLRRPTLLEDQFAVLLEATAGGELRVMLPMVSTREELDSARMLLMAVSERLAANGRALPLAVRVGVMIEVPSAAIMADAMAESADFFSIGTNDLVQYVLAADRTNPVLADLASAFQPAVLRLIDAVVRTGHARGRHVAVCGEAAADPACIPFLVGLGVTELSVSPGSVAAVRAIVAGTDIDRCRALAARAIMAGSLTEVQTLIR